MTDPPNPTDDAGRTVVRGIAGLFLLVFLLGSVACCGSGGGYALTSALGHPSLASVVVLPMTFGAVGAVWLGVESVWTTLRGETRRYRAAWLLPLLGTPVAAVLGALLGLTTDGRLPWLPAGLGFGVTAFVLFLPWAVVGTLGWIGGKHRDRAYRW
ncbi:MAG: hypothetical protein KC621_19050 [Myxococcales bacterium]|nr:hypothetical protein [Myxococcales bacterium]